MTSQQTSLSIEQPIELPIELLYRGAQLNPDAIAAEDPREKISHRELMRRAEALASTLRTQVPLGSHIGLCAQNTIDHLIAHLAIIIGGYVWVPINPKNGATLNRQLITKSGLALLLVDHASVEKVDAGETATLLLRHDDASAAPARPDCQTLAADFYNQPFEPATATSDTTFGIKFTGGTTGEPKGVVQTHGNVAAVVANMQATFQFDQEDANLAVAPLTHGGSHYLFPILSVGGRHLLMPTPDPESILEAFKSRGASVSFMPPTLIYKLLDQLPTQSGVQSIGENFPKLRHLTYSAAPMPPERIAQVIDALGPCLSTVYGQTEAPMTITAMSREEMRQPELQASVGKACLHSDVAILDAQGQKLPTNQTGEVAVRGAIVMSGYFQEPDKTASVFSQDWLLTGDLGYLDDSGYLFLQGRSKELIISGGFNVYPAEVENALSAVEGICESAVFGVNDDYWGERVEAAVTLHPNAQLDGDTIRQRVKSQLGDVKTPKTVYILDQLPRNPVGKVVRREVRELVIQFTDN